MTAADDMDAPTVRPLNAVELRLLAILRKMLDENGDPEQMKTFDLEGWFAHWVHEKLPQLGDKTPADMLRNPEGQRAVEQLIERMTGGLVA